MNLNAWGLIPTFLNTLDPRPAAEQFNERYSFGGGWRPFKGFEFDPENVTITYPDDPPLEAIDKMNFRDERIILFPHAWVMILQKNGDFEISRMD